MHFLLKKRRNKKKRKEKKERKKKRKSWNNFHAHFTERCVYFPYIKRLSTEDNFLTECCSFKWSINNFPYLNGAIKVTIYPKIFFWQNRVVLFHFNLKRHLSGLLFYIQCKDGIYWVSYTREWCQILEKIVMEWFLCLPIHWKMCLFSLHKQAVYWR